MSIKPLADRVVAVKEAPQEKTAAATKTASGILLGEAKETPNTATVSAIGPDVKNVKVGDRIIYKEYSTTNIKIDGVEHLIIKEEDVLATL